MQIDFIITWVDGNDIKWQKEKERYIPDNNHDSSINRYRDMGTLRYWFRGVEKFTPWVSKIHFVTWGHVPIWLNKEHSKLNIVNHDEFIPKEYLPTFNSNTIELNLHRIKGLSDNFVYFNDDCFIIKPMKKKDFFNNGLPCDIAILNSIVPIELFSNILVNNIKIINKHFNKKDVLKNNIFKWLNWKYKKQLFKTIILYPFKQFTGFFDPHLPTAYKKQTFEEVWNIEFETLNNTCINKFRSISDVNHWLFRYWRIVKGEFYPCNISNGKYYGVKVRTDCKKICHDILNQKYKMICINDIIENEQEFLNVKNELFKCFESILPEKSSFEI